MPSTPESRPLLAALLILSGAAATGVYLKRQQSKSQHNQVKAITINRSPEDVAEFWRSHPDAPIARFTTAPGDRGTEVRVGHEQDLRKFKQLLETGGVTTSDATFAGTDLLQPAAQPPRTHQTVGAQS